MGSAQIIVQRSGEGIQFQTLLNLHTPFGQAAGGCEAELGVVLPRHRVSRIELDGTTEFPLGDAPIPALARQNACGPMCIRQTGIDLQSLAGGSLPSREMIGAIAAAVAESQERMCLR